MAKVAHPLPSRDLLARLLRYDPETGLLYWLACDAVPHTPARTPGKRAFSCRTAKGYYRGGLLGRNVMAHRAVWKLHHGTDPIEIDHIDGNPGNNRIENLRAVDRQGNVRNARIRKTNKSGVQGVHRHCGKWVAQIRAGGRQVYLGAFERLEDAAAARRNAERLHGYHPNHGRAA